ncbi:MULTISPECIES: L-lactate dehydrogenase [Lactobacillus]|uniref:L-lactate dehydrogenase n=1 Tax=Lactobacillus panisapium TaxID=2012495 RepID=A0ABX8WE33_9LACO|nr:MULTISPECIES: L-lactate dehydrogenase [Lactobacillus]MCO6531056.1 L-lactate dehydrogenase [Lactobacillus sp.]MCO6533483.1 L-lactate dehydrogenase [Lactobacillus sp.]MCO6534654.1 L-lactate dehydrogenase [Lactobacillus sp.]MCT6820824.1 L-lactate dehydrogenase [Lactobacillus panisapium]MCT6853981.1 L-lactate dehydrogenase [Lactobacillus panisapium]
MTTKIGIIGDGHVGCTVAHELIVSGLVDDLVMIDLNEGKVNADAVDFEDAMANLPNHVNITVNDYSALKDAEIVISTLGKISLESKGDRFQELEYNKKQLQPITESIKKSGFNGILLVISNPVDAITNLYQQLTGLPKERVIGTGTLLDTARMKKVVAHKFDVDPRSVSGFALGEHGNSQFTAWSTVKVLEKPISELAKSASWELTDLEDEIVRGGQTVFMGKHYTNYGVSAAVVRIARAILTDSRTELPVSSYQEKYGTYMSYPAIVGRCGIVARVELNLTPDEESLLQKSAETIKEKSQA